jgi:hypothetical protein
MQSEEVHDTVTAATKDAILYAVQFLHKLQAKQEFSF